MYTISKENIKLIFFSIFTLLLCYGFALTNYSLSVDNEVPVSLDSQLNLGRWGTAYIIYHIFHGHIPYFTLLFSLIVLAIAATLISKIFRFSGINSYIFCALFLTFPQLAYQLVFVLQADAIAIGVLLSALAMQLYISSSRNFLTLKSIAGLVVASLLIMCVIAIYQALILVPVVIYLIHTYQNTYLHDFKFKSEIKKLPYFAGAMLLAIAFYYVSAKILCPNMQSVYLSGADTTNPFVRFFNIVVDNYRGISYYGNKTLVLGTVAAAILAIKILISKTQFALRLFLLLVILIIPFAFSFFITTGYHPPRIQLTSGIVFAFLITQLVLNVKYQQPVAIASLLIVFANMYFITNLYYSIYRISNHDKEIAQKIDTLIHDKYPDFDPVKDYVFFYGALPYEHHNKWRLENSEVFGGSLFMWDNGSNGRIIYMFDAQDVASYKIIDNKEAYLKAKEAAVKTPAIWPSKESVQKIDNIVTVKLGNTEGSPLFQ